MKQRVVRHYIVITGYSEGATKSEVDDVTLGKPYAVHGKAPHTFFFDDSGDRNYGCHEGQTVYNFDVYEKVRTCSSHSM